MVGLNPEVGHEQMAGLNFVHGIAQALWHGKLFHIDLNGQRGIKFDQDLVFGHGDLLNAFALVDLLENGGPSGGPAYTARGTSTTSRPAPRTWTASGRRRPRTCAPTCCSRSARRRSGPIPRCSAALAASRVPSCATPTLNPGETVADLRPTAARTRTSTSTRLRRAGFGFVHLNQLAIEHLLDAR